MFAAARNAAPSPQPARYNEVLTVFQNKFWFRRCVDNNTGVLEKPTIALARYLQPLKNMAEQEDWGQDDIILVNYFVHTFQALYRLQTKIDAEQADDEIVYLAEHDDHIHFHTGLITANMEPIYARFPRNKNAESKDNQYFIGDGRNYNHFFLGAHFTTYCNPLPTQCRYFDDCSYLVMDVTKRLDPNWTHIYDENWDRVCPVLYPRGPRNDMAFKERMRQDAMMKLRGALEVTLNRVKANYRTAIPQYYKSQLQLLLPLCLTGTNKPDLVLTIGREEYTRPQPGKFTYKGATVLTMDMAYQNARLIARPENDWLLAPVTVAEMDTE